jgi:hypothetical protein
MGPGIALHLKGTTPPDGPPAHGKSSFRDAHMQNSAAERNANKELLLQELHDWERKLRLPSLNEAIRLLASEKFHKLTEKEIRCIAEYGAIQIDDEVFFRSSFSTGKEVAACLGHAMRLGNAAVLEDMTRLRATLLGRQEASATRSS